MLFRSCQKSLGTNSFSELSAEPRPKVKVGRACADLTCPPAPIVPPHARLYLPRRPFCLASAEGDLGACQSVNASATPRCAQRRHGAATVPFWRFGGIRRSALEALGRSDRVLGAFDKLVLQPHDIVLVTGPTCPECIHPYRATTPMRLVAAQW